MSNMNFVIENCVLSKCYLSCTGYKTAAQNGFVIFPLIVISGGTSELELVLEKFKL